MNSSDALASALWIWSGKHIVIGGTRRRGSRGSRPPSARSTPARQRSVQVVDDRLVGRGHEARVRVEDARRVVEEVVPATELAMRRLSRTPQGRDHEVVVVRRDVDREAEAAASTACGSPGRSKSGGPRPSQLLAHFSFGHIASPIDARNWATRGKIPVVVERVALLAAHCRATSPPSGSVPAHAPAPRNGVQFPLLIRPSSSCQSSSVTTDTASLLGTAR